MVQALREFQAIASRGVILVLLWRHQTQKPVPRLALGQSHHGSDVLTAAAPGARADPRARACRPAESSTEMPALPVLCSAVGSRARGVPGTELVAPSSPRTRGAGGWGHHSTSCEMLEDPNDRRSMLEHPKSSSQYPVSSRNWANTECPLPANKPPSF